MDRTEKDDPQPPHEPVCGLTLEDHATLSAEIAEGSKPLREILDARHITEADWNQASLTWMKRIGEDALAHRENARLAIVYSDAFSRAQDGLKPVVDMTAADYAALVVAVQKAGSPDEPLQQRRLSNADYIRLSRHWAKILSSDPAQTKTYFDTFSRLQGDS